jgi:hypothetical protein
MKDGGLKFTYTNKHTIDPLGYTQLLSYEREKVSHPQVAAMDVKEGVWSGMTPSHQHKPDAYMYCTFGIRASQRRCPWNNHFIKSHTFKPFERMASSWAHMPWLTSEFYPG